MDQGVEGAADGGQELNRIVQRVLGHDVGGLDATTDELDNRRPRGARGEAALRGGARPQRALRQHHAQALGQAAHGVGGSQEGADARTRVVLERAFDDLALGSLTRKEARAEGLGLRGLDLVVARAGRHQRRRQVDASRGHQHGRDDLVAGAHVDHTVKAALSDNHRLAGICDDLTVRQAVAHACVALGHAVAHADGVELDGLATGLKNALLHLSSKLTERLVAGTNLVPTVGDGDKRLIGVLERVDRHTGGSQVGLRDGALEWLQLVDCALHCSSPYNAGRTTRWADRARRCSWASPRRRQARRRERTSPPCPEVPVACRRQCEA